MTDQDAMLERTQDLLRFILRGSMRLAAAMTHNQSLGARERRRSREVDAAGAAAE